ncbi:related to endocytosis ankyrin repeat protein Nuc-2 [Fusarium oxysporum]|uniref:Related to endocytosis ankyrin repeat protein Nuc-2 n=1 Tax=Fusarium oxysporum TaxID=5507 RepID=A0A2H3TCN7_FUSOX|nr:related to endocytosis ankyrin repeat protein Nuc-2 [Fusarium oxysporum]
MEILGAIASSIALAQAVKGTLKAVDFLRQNSDMKRECDKLRKELLMIDCFIMQAREQTGQMVSAQRLLGIAEHPLISLTIQELEELLEELNEIVEKYSRSRKAHDPKRYTDKVKWFSEASKIEELRERAQAAKSNLHMAITFRVSSMVDRGNVRQEVLFHRVAQQLTYYTQETHHISQTLPRLLQGPQPMPQSSTTSLQPGTQGTTIRNKPDPPAIEENRLTETSEVFLTNNTNQTVTVIKEQSFVTAAEGGLLDALREQPWAIDELDENGHAPIHITVEYYNLLGLEQLIAAKADINRQDVVGRTPLMMAARKGNDTMVQKLLGYFECRRLIGSKVDISGRTALHFAVESGSSACVRLLLEAGAPASKLNRYGEIPMQRLAWGKQEDQQEIYEIIELLRARGADIESKELHGWTPVLRVCRKGNVPVLGALVRAGASLCAIDSKQEGILHHTAYSLNFDIVHYLAEQDLEDIDPQLREISRGDTPLGCLTWIFNEYKLPEVTIPTEDQQKDFIKLYFDLLIRDLERHISTLRDVQEAIEDRDSGATTELLDLLIKRNKDGFRQDLVDWYRGLQSYVSDGQWDNLMEAICEEHDETVEKVKRAAVAREKTMTDPEMKEFF